MCRCDKELHKFWKEFQALWSEVRDEVWEAKDVGHGDGVQGNFEVKNGGGNFFGSSEAFSMQRGGIIKGQGVGPG